MSSWASALNALTAKHPVAQIKCPLERNICKERLVKERKGSDANEMEECAWERQTQHQLLFKLTRCIVDPKS